MNELRHHFDDLQFFAFAAWLILALMMARRGMLSSGLGMTCAITVAFMIGYLCLIAFGVLGAGVSPGLILPDYDAYIEPFPIFFIGVPIVAGVILILLGLDIRRRRLHSITALFVVSSVYLLWASWMAHVKVISGI
jgi:hypothetical protein